MAKVESYRTLEDMNVTAITACIDREEDWDWYFHYLCFHFCSSVSRSRQIYVGIKYSQVNASQPGK